MYKVLFSDKATEDLRALKKSEPQAFKKAMSLIEELADHPKTGRGKPTLKKYDLAGFTGNYRNILRINIKSVLIHIIKV
jgi:toxin YoeB